MVHPGSMMMMMMTVMMTLQWADIAVLAVTFVSVWLFWSPTQQQMVALLLLPTVLMIGVPLVISLGVGPLELFVERLILLRLALRLVLHCLLLPELPLTSPSVTASLMHQMQAILVVLQKHGYLATSVLYISGALLSNSVANILD